MGEIDKMYNLVNSILDERSAVIFLGGGASMEGKQGEKPYPGLDELIDNILRDWGYDPDKKKKGSENFLEVIKRWEDEKVLPARLSKYLEGDPGLAHYYLAALSIALFSEYKVLLYLTTNYDNLMRKAFTDLESNQLRKFTTRLISLPKKITGSKFEQITKNIGANIREGAPVIVKLFGDLDSESPIFREDDMEEVFEKSVIEQMESWLKSPTIFIGYSFKAKIMQSFLSSRNRGNSIFIVNPSDDLARLERDHKGVYHIKKTFSDFIEEMIDVLEKRDIAVRSKIDKILKLADPRLLFPDFDSFKDRVIKCSQVSLMRAEDKLPKIEIANKIKEFVPIDRKDTGPDFQRFVKSEKPLLAVIGDSGSGKSTLLYKLAKNQSNEDFITLFYDVHHLQEPGSLKKRLVLDFNCNIEQFESVFEHIDKILSKENKKLLIMVDGLNESATIDPSVIKSDIDDLGNKLPKSIKIAYSCRTIYWNAYIKLDSRLSPKLYHDSKEFSLHFYSIEEAQDAFKLYQHLYEFDGTFDSLKEEFKEKIRDPLMLRMLAEGYQGESLPKFAPAVRIFKTYEDTLRKKFEGTVLIEFIEVLVSSKLAEIDDKMNVLDQFEKETFITNPALSNLTLQQIGINKRKPVTLLEDEGILSSLDNKKNTYRFTYDRFFEYLLGKEIGKQIKTSSREDFISILSEKILSFQRIHFSFLQALKSEIIRRNIDDPKGHWTFYDPNTLRKLLNNRDAAITNFAKEVLRELTFEAEKNTLDALREITDNELQWKLLALDIASDSPKIKPILIEGLFSSEKHFSRRCVQILSVRNQDTSVREDFEDSIVEKIAKIKYFKEEHAVGLIYYTAVIFSLEDELGNDPFVHTKLFWKRILLSVKTDLELVKKIITSEFIRLVRDEGPYFFGAGLEEDPMEYIWKQILKDERDVALKMIPLIVDTDKIINQEFQEIIRFFGSSIKYWKNRNEPEKHESYCYKFEYRIAEWILLQRSITKYKEVKQILNRFVNNGFWKTIDFALCNMKFILQIIHKNNIEIIKDGFETMKRWTEKFHENNEKFYYTVDEEAPFSIDQNPLAMAAFIDTLYFTPKEGPVGFLEGWLTSHDTKDVRIALLSVRDLWTDNPWKILGTLDLVVNNKDPIIKDWLGRILKEIYLIYPNLVENFFWKNNMSPNWVQEIKYRKDVLDASGFEFFAYPLYKALFLGSNERRILFAEWYKKLFEYENLESYCKDLLNFIFNQIIS